MEEDDPYSRKTRVMAKGEMPANIPKLPIEQLFRLFTKKYIKDIYPFAKSIINSLKVDDVLLGNFYFKIENEETKPLFIDYGINITRLIQIPIIDTLCIYFEVYNIDFTKKPSQDYIKQITEYLRTHNYTYGPFFPIIFAKNSENKDAIFIISPDEDITNNLVAMDPPTHPSISKSKLVQFTPIITFKTKRERQVFSTRSQMSVMPPEFHASLAEEIKPIYEERVLSVEEIRPLNFCFYLFVQALFYMWPKFGPIVNKDNNKTANDLQRLFPLENQGNNCLSYFFDSFQRLFKILDEEQKKLIQTQDELEPSFIYDLSDYSQFPESIEEAYDEYYELKLNPEYLIIKVNGANDVNHIAFPSGDKYNVYYYLYGIGELPLFYYSLATVSENNKIVYRLVEKSKDKKSGFLQVENLPLISPKYFENLKYIIFRKYVLSKEQAIEAELIKN